MASYIILKVGITILVVGCKKVRIIGCYYFPCLSPEPSATFTRRMLTYSIAPNQLDAKDFLGTILINKAMF